MPDEIGLKEFIDVRFGALEKRLDEICSRIVGRDRFDALLLRVDRIEEDHVDLERRMTVAERAVWLWSKLGTVAMAVLTALAIALASGKVQFVWR